VQSIPPLDREANHLQTNLGRNLRLRIWVTCVPCCLAFATPARFFECHQIPRFERRAIGFADQSFNCITDAFVGIGFQQRHGLSPSWPLTARGWLWRNRDGSPTRDTARPGGNKNRVHINKLASSNRTGIPPPSPSRKWSHGSLFPASHRPAYPCLIPAPALSVGKLRCRRQRHE
jgi:hypothetical protein